MKGYRYHLHRGRRLLDPVSVLVYVEGPKARLERLNPPCPLGGLNRESESDEVHQYDRRV